MHEAVTDVYAARKAACLEEKEAHVVPPCINGKLDDLPEKVSYKFDFFNNIPSLISNYFDSITWL
jgi:hypothetical protein